MIDVMWWFVIVSKLNVLKIMYYKISFLYKILLSFVCFFVIFFSGFWNRKNNIVLESFELSFINVYFLS